VGDWWNRAVSILLVAVLVACGKVEEVSVADAGSEDADASTPADATSMDASTSCADGWTGARCDECTVYVHDANGNDDQPGLSWDAPLATLSAGIQRAQARRGLEGVDACAVWVSAGVYVPGHERTDSFRLVPHVHVYGGFSGHETERDQRNWEANQTILSGDLLQDDDPDDTSSQDDNAFHVVTGANDAILDGFVIMAGVANGDSATAQNLGGGMRNVDASPTLRNIVFRRNRATGGGAMHNAGDSSPMLENVSFIENSAGFTGTGGAVLSVDESAPILVAVEFVNNSAGRGGAIFVDHNSAPGLSEVLFASNVAHNAGGAIVAERAAQLSITNARFLENSAGDFGGAISTDDSIFVEITNAVFLGNYVTVESGDGAGGAIARGDSGTMTLTNVTFNRNSVNPPDPLLGAAGAIFNSGTLNLRNTILWGNEDNQGQPEISGVSGASIRHSIVQGGEPDGVGEWLDSLGEDLAAHDPRFVDPSSGNLELLPNSPAIDAGNSLLPGLPDFDLNGNPRVVDGNEDGSAVIDMGAFEFQP
jgi:predicted outer membrane repeat protein